MRSVVPHSVDEPNILISSTQAINNGVSMVTAIIGMIIFDSLGRRSVTFYGCIFQAVFLCLIGALGAKPDRTASDTHGMVASFIIYAAILHMTLGPAAYITAAEIGSSSLREKTMSIAVSLRASYAVRVRLADFSSRLP